MGTVGKTGDSVVAVDLNIGGIYGAKMEESHLSVSWERVSGTGTGAGEAEGGVEETAGPGVGTRLTASAGVP